MELALKQEPLTPKGILHDVNSSDKGAMSDVKNVSSAVANDATAIATNNNHCNGVNNNLSQGNPVRQCNGCGTHILDRFLLYALDRYWHTGCLKCSCCQAPLGEIGSTCFTKSGMILCRNDYMRMFGSTGRCSACARPIPASEMVMKAQGHVYHVACFACVTCHNKLVPGDRYSIFNGSLLCEIDFPKAVRAAHSQASLRASHKVS